MRQSINPLKGGSPILVPLNILHRKWKREKAGGRANYDARLKLIAKTRCFARAHALESFAKWFETMQVNGGSHADLANQLLKHDPGLLRLLTRRKLMLPRMLADETESLVVQVCAYIHKIYKILCVFAFVMIIDTHSFPSFILHRLFMFMFYIIPYIYIG